MGDIQLFRLEGENAVELSATSAKLERKLQRLIEGQMEVLLGVRLLASEYVTGKRTEEGSTLWDWTKIIVL